MNNSTPKLSLSAPAVLLCIAQPLAIFLIIILFFFSSIDRYSSDNFGIAAILGGIVSGVLIIIAGSVAAGRFSGAGRPTSGPVMLIVSGVVFIVAYSFFIFSVVDTFHDGDNDMRALFIVCPVVISVMMAITFKLMAAQEEVFKQSMIHWIVAGAVLVIWGLIVIATNPHEYYNTFFEEYKFTDLDALNTVTGVSLVPLLILFAAMLTTGLKTIRYFKGTSPRPVVTAQASYSSPAQSQYQQQSQSPYNAYNGQADHSSYMPADHSAYMPNEQASARQTAANEQPIDPRLMAWAQSLTPEQLKYVIFNPGAYDKAAVDACAREMANRI